MDYELSYGATPLLGDLSRVYRAKGYEEARKHEPLADLMDELDRLIPTRYLQDLSPGPPPSRTMTGLAAPARLPQDPRATQVKVGDWYYPNTAQRFSVFRGLATSRMVKAMLATTGGTATATFKMKAVPVGATTTNTYSLSTSMYMLPPRPLGEADKKFDGLFLVTLVDERFYFGGSPITLRPNTSSTWTGLINQCATNLGITLTITSAISSDYGQPEPDSPLWCNFENAAILLDALATNVGRVVIRNFNGTYTLNTHIESQTQVVTNRGTNVLRVAGGDLFNSGNLLVAGSMNAGRNSVVPASFKVTFPKYIYGANPVPHFLNPRTTSGRGSVWNEEGYGDVHALTITPANCGATVSGIAGVSGSTATIRTDAKAYYSTEALAASGLSPDNLAALTTLATRVATDRYEAAFAAALDEVYPGTFVWTPEGLHDIVWTYSEKAGLATTRVMHAEWNIPIEEGQYAIPYNGAFASGVGGRSVAQTWRDNSNTIQFGVNLVTAGTGLTLTKGTVTSGGISEAIITTATPSTNTTNNTWYWSGEVGIDFMEGPNLFTLSPIFIGVWNNLSGNFYNFWPFFQLHGCFNLAGQPPADPAAFTSVTASSSTPGTIPTGLYYFSYTNVNGKYAQSAPSPVSAQTSVTLGQSVTVVFPSTPADTADRNLYMTVAGGAAGSETMVKSGITGSSFTYTGTTGVTDPFKTDQTPPSSTVYSNAYACFNPPDCCGKPTWTADGGSLMNDRCATPPTLWIQSDYATGTAWESIIGTVNPGDTIYGGSSTGDAAILPIGTNGSIYMVVAGLPAWVLPAGRVAGSVQLLGIDTAGVLTYYATGTC